MKKKNLLGVSLAVLSTTMLAGIGYGAWTITDKTSKTQDTNIGITADSEVKDVKYYTLGTGSFDNKDLYFGGPTASEKTSVTADPWFTFSGTEECLTTTYTLPITYADSNTPKPNVTATLDAKSFNAAAEQTKVASKYVVSKFSSDSPALPAVEETNQSGNTHNWKVTITLKWGDAVGNENPYVYFNKLTYSETNATNAKSCITKLSNLKSCTLNLKIVVSAPSSNQ